MGSISAAEACLASPHRVKALVLVAPALIAPQRLLSLAPPLSPAHQPPGPSFPSGTPPLSPPVSLLEALRLPGTRPPADGAREGLGVVAWAVGAARWVIGHTVLRVLQPVALAAMRAFVRREQSW